MALTKETPILKPIIEKIPAEMKLKPQWALYRAEPNKSNPQKLDKVPYQPNGRKAAVNRKHELSTFEEIEKAYSTGEFDGILFGLTEDDPYIGLDIDGEDLKQLSTAANSLSSLSYTEISPSGSGLHVILKGKLPDEVNHKKNNLEIYDNGRFLSFTGNVFTDIPILNQQSIVDAIVRTHFGIKEAREIKQSVDFKPFKTTNAELWLRMFNSKKNGAEIKALYNGESGDDPSRADLALCNHLAFYTQRNYEQMDSMFRESGLMRPKWDESRGSNTYGYRTITKAIQDCKNVYDPQQDSFQIHILGDKPQFKLCFSGKEIEVSPGIKKYESGIELYGKWRVAAERAGDWRASLEYSINDKKDTSTLLRNARNVELILRNELMESLALDEFANKRMVIAPIPWRTSIKEADEWKSQGNVDDSQLCHWLAVNWNIKDKETIFNALIHILQERTFHPIKEFIESVEWDGEIRVPTFFCDYLLADHSKYTYEVTKRWFTGAVKRIYEPGCKFEIMPVLTGEKGIGKSYLSSKLANDKWFTDSLRSVEPKVAGEILSDVWICEIAELTALKNATADDIKAFISSCNDRFRGAYDRGNASEHKRHSVFIGTTNKSNFISDETGERRQMPIKCHATKETTKGYEITPETVAQIWAEAKVYYDQGYLTYIDSELQDLAEAIHEQYKDIDPLEGEIDEFVKLHGAVCVRQIWKDVMADDKSKKPGRSDSNRIVRILTSLGYEQIGFETFKDYGKQRIYGTRN